MNPTNTNRARAQRASAAHRIQGDPDAPLWCAIHRTEFPNLIAALEQGAMTHQARAGRPGVTMDEAWYNVAPFDPQDHQRALDFSRSDLAWAWAEIED